MAYAEPFLRLVVEGALYTQERFAWGLSLIPDFNPTPEGPASVPQAVIDAVTAFHTAAGVSCAAAKMDTIKLNLIGTDGRYASTGDTVRHDFLTPVPGASSTNPAPQLALAVSLMTARARGRAARGRFYIPAPSQAPNADGIISSSGQGQVLTASTTLLNSLNAALSGFRVGVVSNIGAGASEIVTNVRVGRVLDTMRSRRRSFAEDYVDGASLAP